MVWEGVSFWAHLHQMCTVCVVFFFFIFCELNFDPGVIWFCFFWGEGKWNCGTGSEI